MLSARSSCRNPTTGVRPCSIRLPAAARAGLGESAHDPELSAWLRKGPPPVYFGLGSMPVRDPGAMIRLVAAATHKRGERAVIGAGWSAFEGAETIPEHVRLVGALDHDWLFKQCRAAVHHGWAGTVFTAASAGLPSVVCSVFADQPFWGARLERPGVGVHLLFKKLDAASLDTAMERISKPDMGDKAARLGERLRAEPDATPSIVALVEQLGATPRMAT